MKWNIFNSSSPGFKFRWFIIIALCITAFMTWNDLTGRRMFVPSQSNGWSSSGPGYHK